jgi:hypothetical protein
MAAKKGRENPAGLTWAWPGRCAEEDELPPSQTVYDSLGLEPTAGCCTVFDSWPQLGTGPALWADFTDQEPPLWGYLKQAWNAHPAGSLVLTQTPMELGMTIIDLATSPP